jgi:UDP-glucose 4-epimerase
MNVVVTGATGGVGSRIVERFASEGHDVLGLDLERPPGEHENATFLAADLTDQGQAWEPILAHGPDAVLHFAAIPRVGIEPGAETFLTNV